MLTPRSILVIRLSSLGDVALTTPVFQALRRSHPGARLSVLVKKSFAPVFHRRPDVDDVFLYEELGFWGWAKEIRRRGFDVVVDLHDTPRSRLWSLWSGAPHKFRYNKRAGARRWLVWTKRESPDLSGGVVDRYLEAVAPLLGPNPDPIPKLYVFSEERLSLPWDARLGKGPWVAVAPGAQHATKRWPAERFADAADRLAESLGGAKILIFGSATDRPEAEAVLGRVRSEVLNLAGETSLREMMQILSRCSILLTNDSGAMHVGAGLGVPTLAVFGPTVKAFGFFPRGPRTAVVETSGLDCRPCAVHGSARCPQGHFRCMTDLSVERVVEESLRLLRG